MLYDVRIVFKDVKAMEDARIVHYFPDRTSIGVLSLMNCYMSDYQLISIELETHECFDNVI